jgi:hypothetical protein
MHNFQRIPVAPENVALFIAYLANKNTKNAKKPYEYTTVVNYVASLASLHTANGLEPPDLAHHSIRAALAGLKRNRFELPHRKKGIKINHLLAIHESLGAVSAEKRDLFWSACLLLFFSMLRRSNVFADNQNDFALRRRDVRFSDSGLTLTVKSIKNTRFKGIKYELFLPLIPNNVLCPVSAIAKVMKNDTSAQRSAPLLSYARNSFRTAFTAKDFTEILKASLSRIGLRGDLYSIHSFRRGAATFASASGITAAAIKTQGAWRSRCWEGYVDRDTALRKSFATSMATAARKCVLNRNRP